jgi:DNA-binding HxlR family transcriptional regulator
MLASRLKRLEADGVVERRVEPTSPPSVEYRLSPLGSELKPAIEAIVGVGHRLKELNGIDATDT